MQEAAIIGVLGGVLRRLSSLEGARLGRARRAMTVSGDPHSRVEGRQLSLARRFDGPLRRQVSGLYRRVSIRNLRVEVRQETVHPPHAVGKGRRPILLLQYFKLVHDTSLGRPAAR